jgi:hypothetical protein
MPPKLPASWLSGSWDEIHIIVRTFADTSHGGTLALVSRWKDSMDTFHPQRVPLGQQ